MVSMQWDKQTDGQTPDCYVMLFAMDVASVKINKQLKMYTNLQTQHYLKLPCYHSPNSNSNWHALRK